MTDKLAEALRRACDRIENQTKVTEAIISRGAHPNSKMSDGSHVIQTLNTHVYAAIKDARAALAEHDANGGWTPIADIPDEWKDGREVDLWTIFNDQSGFERHTDCKFAEEISDWATHDYYLHDMEVYPTHARLPPKPPQ